jgi:hypothetical protein
MTINILSLLIGLFAGAAIVGLYMELRHLKDQMKGIQADQAKALPHGTLANLEDIHAVINDVKHQNSELDKIMGMDIEQIIKWLLISQAMRGYQDEGLTRVKELVTDIQQNPRKYKDRPNRKRAIV